MRKGREIAGNNFFFSLQTKRNMQNGNGNRSVLILIKFLIFIAVFIIFFYMKKFKAAAKFFLNK